MNKKSDDLREDCKYGNKCYQKNQAHHARFKHPPKDEEPPSKKPKEVMEKGPVFLSVNRLFPADFLTFYDWCKTINYENPCKALYDATGAILSTDFHNMNNEMKWRFYYDPPEFLTLLVQVDNSEICTEKGEHFGYFWDDPKEYPAFVGRIKNNSSKIKKMGDNLFAAVFNWIQELSTHSDPFKKTKLRKVQESLRAYATSKNFSLELQSEALKLRDKKVVARPFHGVGLVVPFNKKTCLGYREIPESTGALKKIFKKAADSSEDDDRMDAIQELITCVQFANDEGDPGMGLELGLNLFSFENGCDDFHPAIKHLLCGAYNLLNRDHFSKVVEVHLSRRRKGETVLTN